MLILGKYRRIYNIFAKFFNKGDDIMMNLIVTVLLLILFFAILVYDKKSKDYEEVISITFTCVCAVILYHIMKLI